MGYDSEFGVFLGVVISRPSQNEKDDGVLPTIVVPLFVVPARDLAAATMEAGRKVPEGMDMNKVQVLVRPF